MASHIEPAKAELKSADTKESDQTRTTPTGGIEKPAATESVKEKASNPPPAGGANKASEGGSGEDKEDEKKDQSESLVKGSYLPVNKLKDAPDASKYEGKDPKEFTKVKGPGLGEQLAQKAHNAKEKITSIGSKDKSSS